MKLSAKFSASLYRVVARGAAKEAEDRPYLKGVLVEPCPTGGVILVATNGEILLVAHDPRGEASGEMVIKMPRYARRACKALDGEGGRLLVITGRAAAVQSGFGDSICLVDQVVEPRTDDGGPSLAGYFPPWRRVIPTKIPDASPPAVFDGRYLRDMARVGRAFRRAHHGDDRDRTYPPMRLTPTGAECPALIRWRGIESAFGVLMPMRINDEMEWRGLPSFALADFPVQGSP